MRRVRMNVTTAADGSATAYSPRVSGKVHSIQYKKTDFADGVDFTITADTAGETLWTEANVNAAATKRPRAATHTTAGVAATLDGTVAALDQIAIANDKVKIVIAQGGATKSGTFDIFLD